ncbi:MAG: sigma-54-dependent Fis family transcriptional regulator [Pirellulales bacterium]|nr:sigma-54-dependent Fis family transcriptional regulator [Pirellulales bacterium]
MPPTKPTKRLKLLFADDEKSLQEVMRLELPRMGHEATVCPDGTAAVAALERNTYDCILVDLDMPGLSGLEVIDRAKRLSPDVEAVILTGKSSLETAVAALRQGVFDYLTKPCKLLDLESVLQRVAEKRELTNQFRALKQRLERWEGKSSELIGDSEKMLAVKRLIAKVAPTDSTVLITGETGTGKELAARSIHEQSLRTEKPLVPINCGALPENLIESELFGHRKGAFTGADEHRRGLIEVADGGTLFLDEIGELPKGLQSKLLRFLESGEIRRVGDNEAFTCNVRVVCATNRHLDEMVSEGDFREDLWYRINTFEIELPPLREHLEDVSTLARHLAVKSGARIGSAEAVFTPEALEVLCSHHWPGNVRELANVIEHALILCDRIPLRLEHLPHRFSEPRATLPLPRPPAGSSSSLREMEMQAICDALERHNGNKPKAAEELGISLKTLYNKLNQAQAVSKSA